MFRVGREGPGAPRRATTALAAMVAALILGAAPGCGARGESSATAPPTPPPAGSAPAASRTTFPPVARLQGFSDPTYARGENWLCGPDASTDRCAVGNQDTTVVKADGQATERSVAAAADPVADCFYVYPSVDTASSPSNLIGGRDTGTEDDVIFEQAARLRERCRVFAPLYRQSGTGVDAGVSYSDVANAFKLYLSRSNRGRPFILFGDGQGADHLTRLLQEEFDDDADMRARLVAAYLIGGHADVANGSKTGGSFRNIPTCSSAIETSCVVGWSATTPSTPRDVAARWGEAPAGRTRLCVNPARLLGGAGLLKAIVPASDDLMRRPVAVSTPFLELPEVLAADCTTNGPVTTLVLRPPGGDPGADARDAGALTANAPGTGLHTTEVSLALGTIIDLISEQIAALHWRVGAGGSVP